LSRIVPIGIVFGFVSTVVAAPQQSATRDRDTAIQQFSALTGQYCNGCHSQAAKTGGIVLEKRDFNSVAADADTWERVIRKLRAGEMPPQGLPHPTPAAVDQFAAWLEQELDKAAAAKPNPGRTLVHRLNRTEYGNAIKDVLALDIDPSQLLPPDDSASGFDNIAQMLILSPALIEQYLSASAKVAQLAVGDPSIKPFVATYHPAADLSQNKHIPGTPLGTLGGISVVHYFPLDAEYEFSPSLSRSILGQTIGLEDRHAAEVTIDDVRIKLLNFGGDQDNIKALQAATAMADDLDRKLKFRMRMTAGPHRITVSFLRQSEAQTAEMWQQFVRTEIDANETKGFPHLEKVTVFGPFKVTGHGDTPARRRIFTCQPTPGKDDLPCAKQILTSLAARAYRRPLTDKDTEKLLTFFQQGRNSGGSFDKGVETAIRRMISGPEFIFRSESDPADVAPNVPYRVSDIELASRLSFFLWSTIPDDQLMDLAKQGRLKDPQVLQAQVRRMLADPKANALVDNFAAQWLQLRNLRGVVPDPDKFPDFDDNLRQAMVTETEMLFGSVMNEDRPVTDLLTADYTFVNERLARHYGIPGIYGDRFRRVSITDPNRRGLLGQASILTLTSVATRTSPVVRGKWVLTNILGTPPPPPIPNVPPLKELGADKPKSMRERMSEHRANAVCATCHKTMDPIGFSLENFDAVGQWRTNDGGAPIDAADDVFGAKVDGAEGLRNFLLSRNDVFIETFTEKLMTYGLGRATDAADAPYIRKIMADSTSGNYKFSSLVMGIVMSPPFQMRIKSVQTTEAAAPASTVAAVR
jgi:mono/diheme cytochrome c family protein